MQPLGADAMLFRQVLEVSVVHFKKLRKELAMEVVFVAVEICV